jgi:hypothetical protein
LGCGAALLCLCGLVTVVYDRHVNGVDWSMGTVLATCALTVFFLLVAALFSTLEIDIARKEVRSIYRGYHWIARRYSLYRKVEVEPLSSFVAVHVEPGQMRDGIRNRDVYTVGLLRHDGVVWPIVGPLFRVDEEVKALSEFTQLPVKKSWVVEV